METSSTDDSASTFLCPLYTPPRRSSPLSSLGRTQNPPRSAELRRQNCLNCRREKMKLKLTEEAFSTRISNNLLTLIRLHAAQSQLVRECDVGLGVTFDLVVQHDRVRPPRVAPRSALHLCLGDCGHVAGHVVYGDGDVLRVGAKSRAGQGDDRTARPYGK